MRIKITHIALVIAIIALAVSLFTAVRVGSDDTDALIDALMAQNQQLQEQLDALTGQNGDPGTDAFYTAELWADGQGADLELILLLPEDPAGADVTVEVLLGEAVIAQSPCQPGGNGYTALLSVPAANGYTYTLTIGSAVYTLASPDRPVYPELVNLADALGSYCNLIVGEWEVSGEVLTLSSCHAHVQTPRLGSEGIACTEARAVLKNGDTILSSQVLELVPGEGIGSFECQAADMTLELPQLEEGLQADLWLEATLSNGQVLSSCAATWYATADGYSMAAG